MGRHPQAPIMFAFNPVIGDPTRSFNLFLEEFRGGLTGPKAPAANSQRIGQPSKTFSPIAARV